MVRHVSIRSVSHSVVEMACPGASMNASKRAGDWYFILFVSMTFGSVWLSLEVWLLALWLAFVALYGRRCCGL